MIGALLLATIAQAADAPLAAVQSLRAIHRFAGCWSIKGREIDTNVDTFVQDGIARITVDALSGGIRLDEIYRVREASGGYTRLPPERRFSELLYFDAPTRLFAVRAAEGQPGTPNKVSLAPNPWGAEAFWTSLYRSDGRGMDLLASHRRRFVHPDRIEMRSHLYDPHGSFEELYTAVWSRLPDGDRRCVEVPAATGQGS